MAAIILLAAVACGVLAATPQETLTVSPPASPPKAEEKAPPYYTRSNPFAPLPHAEEPKDRTPPPPAEEPVPRPEAPKTSPPAPSAPAEETAPATPSVPRLNGILCSNRLSLAIVNDSLVKAGDQIGAWRITTITPQSVTIEREGTAYVMTPRRPVAQAVAAPPAATGTAPPGAGKNEPQASPKAEAFQKSKAEAIEKSKAEAAEKSKAGAIEKKPPEPKAEGDRKP
jgi:hypothetical protein